MSFPADIQDLHDQLEANTRDARAVIEGLTPEQGEWRAAPGSWSVAQCLDHLATGSRVYFHVLASHGRRHLWQARNVRQAAEQARTLP